MVSKLVENSAVHTNICNEIAQQKTGLSYGYKISVNVLSKNAYSLMSTEFKGRFSDGASYTPLDAPPFSVQ